MASGIELEIQQLLKNINEPALVADELLKKWHRNELTTDDVDRVAHFLITFGFHNALAENLALKAKEKALLPWGAVARIIATTSEKPSKEVVDNLFVGASEQESLDLFVRMPSLDAIDTRFAKIRTEMTLERKMKFVKLRSDYLDQIAILRNDRMFEKERDLLKRLLEYFPNDPVIKEQYAELSTRQARERLDRRSSWLTEEELYYRKEQEIPAELKAVAEEIAEKLFVKVSKNPEMAYNLALGLFQMGHLEAALKILNKAPESTSTDWLKIDLLLESHRYLDVLGELDRLEKKYASDPEITFSTLYLRAQALWGLHQHKSAIEVLESLVKVRPDYRSAHTLLTQWREGLA